VYRRAIHHSKNRINQIPKYKCDHFTPLSMDQGISAVRTHGRIDERDGPKG
jgi:hypothetical protein